MPGKIRWHFYSVIYYKWSIVTPPPVCFPFQPNLTAFKKYTIGKDFDVFGLDTCQSYFQLQDYIIIIVFIRKICQELLLFELFLVSPLSLLFSLPTHLLFSFLTQEPENYEHQGGHDLHEYTLHTAFLHMESWILSFKQQPWCFWYLDNKVCGNLGLLFCNGHKLHWNTRYGFSAILGS